MTDTSRYHPIRDKRLRTTNSPSGWRSSWVGLLTLFTLAGFVETTFYGQVSAFTPLYLPSLGVPAGDVPRWTGLIAALTTAFGLPFLPFWGALADRYTRKPLIVRSFVAHLAGAVGMLVSGDIWTFLLARAATSLALGNSGLMMTTLSERTPPNRIGLAFAIMNSAPPVGAFLGPLIGGPVVDSFGFPSLMVIDVALLSAVVLALSVAYRDPFKGTDRGTLVQMAIDSVGILLRSRRLRTLFPALFLLFAGWMMAFTYVPLAVTALYRGDDPGTAVGVVVGAGGVIPLVLSPALGSLADRKGHWRVLFPGAFILVALWPLPALASDLVTFAVLWSLLNGMASSVFAISFTVLSSSAASDVRGRVMSFAYLPVNVGILVGSSIGSLVTRGNVFAVFPVAAALTGLGALGLVLAARQPVASGEGLIDVRSRS